MKEKSCGAVIFREIKERKYLLLHYPHEHWDFPKGNIEKGEKEEETVAREVEEETGIKKIKFIRGFKEKISYFYRSKGNLISKEVIFFLVETKEKDVKISFEHKGFEWLNYEDALKRLTFKNAKEILKKSESYLNSSLRKFIK